MSAVTEERARRRAEAVQALATQSRRRDAAQIVARLDDGLGLLRSLLYTRVQADVEHSFGVDSMIVPLSHARTEQETKSEIEAFLLAESLDEISQANILPAPMDWLRPWLLELRLSGRPDRPHITQRAAAYARLEPRQRCLDFSDVLERTLAEARHAPIILYQLFPLAVRVATALALGDHLRAGAIRGQQTGMLPPIAYCRFCHGGLLEVDDNCRECGNPVWTIRWLTQAD
jgi:hypothetical protein